MNKVIIMGRLTREPNITYSHGEQQMAVARFTVAVDHPGARNSQEQNQPTADFISCVAFDKQGQFAEQYLHQGTKIVLEGRIRTGSYTNLQGQRVYTTDVVAERIEFAESKAAQQNHPNAADPGYTMQQGQQYYQQSPAPQAPVQQQSRGRRTNTSAQGTARPASRSANILASQAAAPTIQDEGGYVQIPDGVMDEGLPFN